MIYQQPNFSRAAMLSFNMAHAGRTVTRFVRVNGVWIIETREAN